MRTCLLINLHAKSFTIGQLGAEYVQLSETRGAIRDTLRNQFFANISKTNNPIFKK